MATTSRLLSSGSQLVNGEFDEVSLTAGAIAFNGTNQYLSMASNAGLNFGTGDFTVEAWVYPNSLASDWFIISSSGSGGFFFGFNSTAIVGFGWGRTAVAWDYRVAGNATVGVWQHVAVTRSGTSMRLFVNGTQSGTTQTIATAYDLSTTSTTIGSQGAAYYLSGYISNLRVVKGSAVYTANFTPPQSVLPAVTNTSLLLNVVDSASFITDNSPNAFALTNNNTATYNVNSPFGINNTGSINLAGNTQWLSIPSSTGLNLGDPGYPTTVSGPDFTIELWFYCTSFSSGVTIINKDGVAATSYSQYGYSISSGGVLTFYVGHGDNASTGTGTVQNFTVGTVSLNTWYHVAACQSSTNQIKVFLNGTLVSTTTRTQLMVDGGKPLLVGWEQDQSTASRFPGYITNFRILKNTALYSTSFTPAGPLYPITNTSVLLNACDSSIFLRDSSQTNATVTNNGTATFSSFRPQTGFLLASQRMTSAGMLEIINQFDEVSFTPGSWALSGSSGVTVGNSSVFALPGDFTVEFFFYLSSVPSTEIDFWESQTTSSFRILKRGSSSGLSYDAYGGTSYLIVADASIPTNAWNHVAVSRTGTTVQAYFNGTRTINQTDATSFAAPTANYSVGCRVGGTNGLSGSISNFRLITGAGMYTGATIPVPSAPLGNVTGTQLLLPTPYTGGAFFDYSTNNFTVTKVSTPASGSGEPFTVNTPQRLTSTGILQVAADFDEVSLTAGSIAYGTGQYLTVPSNAAFIFGTGDFTIEAWVYLAGGTTGTIFDNRTGTTSTQPVFYFPVSATTMQYYIAGAGAITSGSYTFLNRWVHVALCRASGSTRMFFDGVQTGSTYADTTNYVASGTVYTGAGASPVGTNQLNGYISNLRVLKGTGLYTANFTPPQSVLPAVTNTSLLLNVIDSNNFITDSSVNNFTLTNVGTATWTASGPFNS